MTTIEEITIINAPIEICFQLSLSVDLELRAAANYHIRALGGVTSGIIGAGQRVEWQTRQFGVPVRHMSEIPQYQQPAFFQDSMVRGMFELFVHDHFFQPMDNKRTQMRDSLRFKMPFLLMGGISERFIVRPRLHQLLNQRNTLIKKTAEATC